jgi:hypothetical protein
MVMDQLVIPLSSPSLDLMVLDPAGIHLIFMFLRYAFNLFHLLLFMVDPW